MPHKASTFKDQATIAKVMGTSNPVQQKHLGKQIAEFDLAVWHQNTKLIAKVGLLAKFEQNPSLLTALLDTTDKKIFEANRQYNWWGIGRDLQDNIADIQNHPGLNISWETSHGSKGRTEIQVNSMRLYTVTLYSHISHTQDQPIT